MHTTVAVFQGRMLAPTLSGFHRTFLGRLHSHVSMRVVQQDYAIHLSIQLLGLPIQQHLPFELVLQN